MQEPTIDVSEERIASVIRVTGIGELGTMLVVTRKRRFTTNVVPSSPILVTVMMEAIGSSETSVSTRATWYHIPEDGSIHSHHRGNLKTYMGFWTLSTTLTN
jgi:hypothetical protein